MMLKKNTFGFTLIELLISIILVSILLVPISTLYRTVFTVFYSQWSRSGLKGETGRAIAAFGSDFRQARNISSALASNISFTMDSNGDGVLETISYDNFNFTYYGANNTLLSFPVNVSQIEAVGVNITAVDNDESFFLTSKVKVRS